MLVPSLSSSPSKTPPQVAVSERYLFVRETKGKNRSPEIDSANRNAGVPDGSPYCTSILFWWLDKAGVKYPQKKSGLARSMVIKSSFTALDVLNGKCKVLAGDVIIWQKGKTPFGHAGLAREDWKGASGKTTEGNTSSGIVGSQSDGDGVYHRTRRIEPMNYFRIKYFTRFKIQELDASVISAPISFTKCSLF